MSIRSLSVIVLLLAASSSQAAINMRTANPNYVNEVGIGASYGWKLDKNADFWGFAPDYTRTFAKKWVLNLSFAYDNETDRKDGVSKETESWTPSAILGYQVSNRWAFGLGVGHGLFEKSDGGDWKSIKWGDDVSAALAGAVTLYSQGRHGVSMSFSYEHGFSDDEPSVSIDLGYGFGF